MAGQAQVGGREGRGRPSHLCPVWLGTSEGPYSPLLYSCRPGSFRGL